MGSEMCIRDRFLPTSLPISPDGAFCRCVDRLSFGVSQARGTLPSELGNLQKLSESFQMRVMRNRGFGSVVAPSVVLRRISPGLSSSRSGLLDLRETNLTGTIPSELGLLENLGEPCVVAPRSLTRSLTGGHWQPPVPLKSSRTR